MYFIIPTEKLLDASSSKPLKKYETVSYQICRYTSAQALLNADLTSHTRSSKQYQLETRGMFYIQLTHGDKKELVKLKRGAELDILISIDNKTKDFQTFEGEKNQDLVCWEPTGRKAKILSPSQASSKLASAITSSEPSGEEENISNLNLEGFLESDYILLKSKNLGWINCDRFYDVEEKQDLIVQFSDSGNISGRMIFHSIQSILPGYYHNFKKSSIQFSNIPTGEKVTVILFKKGVKNSSKIKFWTYSTFNIENKKVIAGQWLPYKEKEFQQLCRKFGW